MVETIKMLLRRIFKLAFKIVILNFILGLLFSFVVLKFEMINKYLVLSLVIYVFSFYSLFTFVILLYYKGKDLVLKLIPLVPYGEKYLNDLVFKNYITKGASLMFSMFFAFSNIFIGLYSKSVWLIGVGIYYFLLSIGRFLLTYNYHKAPTNKKLIDEYKNYKKLVFSFYF